MDRKTLPVLVLFLLFISCSLPKSGIDYTVNKSRVSDKEMGHEHESDNVADDWLVERNEIGNLSHDKKTHNGKVASQDKRKNTPDKHHTSSEKGKRYKLVHVAKEYLGTPYRYGGDGPRRFDCSGFTKYCMREVGVELARTSRIQSRQGKRIPIRKARKGDLIFFGKRGNVQHVGIIVKNTGNSLLVIHASSSHGVMVQDIMASSYWRPRIMYASDIIGTAESEIAISGK